MKTTKGIFYAYPTSEASKNGYWESGCWLLRVNDKVVYRDLSHDVVLEAAKSCPDASWDLYSMHEGEYI